MAVLFDAEVGRAKWDHWSSASEIAALFDAEVKFNGKRYQWSSASRIIAVLFDARRQGLAGGEREKEKGREQTSHRNLATPTHEGGEIFIGLKVAKAK